VDYFEALIADECVGAGHDLAHFELSLVAERAPNDSLDPGHDGRHLPLVLSG
jgi:hypothetical protein